MEIVTSSGLKSSSVAIYAAPCYLHGITLIQAAAAATVIAYDNATTNAGTVVEQVNTTTNVSTNNVKFNNPVKCNNGIYAAVTGSGAGFIVFFSPI